MRKQYHNPSGFLWRLATGLLVVTSVFIYYYFQAVQINEQKLISHEATLIELGKASLTTNFEAIITDLLVISKITSQQLGHTPQQWSDLKEALLVISTSKGIYAQIRFIDTEGMERLRIDHDGQQAHLVPDEELQDKSERNYVQESLKLDQQEVYVSAMELNVENGEVERPLKPMIRASMPVFDNHGRKKGIVTLNYFASDTLQHFVQSHISAIGKVELLNSDGYWLHADTPDDEWGFMLPERNHRNFANDFPVAWRTIHTNDMGTIQTDNGLFIFTTIFPILESVHVQKGLSILAGERKSAASAYHWKAVSYISTEQLSSIRHKDALNIIGIFFLLSTIIAFILWLISRSEELKQKAAENSIKAAIQDGALDAIISFDENGRIVEFNSAATEAFGYAYNEALENNFFDLVSHQNERPLSTDNLEKLLNQHLRGLATHRAGHTFPIDLSITHIDLVNSHLYTCFIRDISEQIKAEERYQAIFAQAGDAIIIIDLKSMRILEFNDQACRQLGYSREEFTQLSLADIDGHFSKMGFAEQVRQLNRRHNFEARHCAKNGELLDVLVNSRTVSIGGEEVILAICTDISNQKRIEKQLKEREDELRTLLDSTAEGIFGVDRNGDCILVNRACLEMTGFDNEADVLGKNMHALLQHHYEDSTEHPEEQSSITRAIHQGIKSHVSNEIFWRRDGSAFPVEYYAHPVFDNRDITGAVVTFMDISERLSLEEQFRQAQKMESIGTLVGGIAHEFNNLLAGMTGNIYLAKHDLDQPQKALKELEQVETLSFKAAEMIQQLLSFARKGVVELRTFNLTAYLKEALKLNRFAIPENIDFRTQICSEQIEIHADANQIQQVLINLLSNAADALAHKKEGKISLGVEKIACSKVLADKHPHLADKELAHIFVEDNGNGIPAESIDKIFEPFFTTKDVGDGTGLGLSMVYGTLQTHQGAVEVESNPGRGACFHLYLPIQGRAEKKDSGDKPASPLRGAGETILVVDDDEIVRTIGIKILQGLGYKTLEATDGVEAVSLFDKHQSTIDAIIMDIVMPNLGGVDAARKIRAIQPDANIIFATAYDKQSTLEEIPELRELPLLRKPFPVEEIIQTLQKVLHSSD